MIERGKRQDPVSWAHDANNTNEYRRAHRFVLKSPDGSFLYANSVSFDTRLRTLDLIMYDCIESDEMINHNSFWKELLLEVTNVGGYVEKSYLFKGVSVIGLQVDLSYTNTDIAMPEYSLSFKSFEEL